MKKRKRTTKEIKKNNGVKIKKKRMKEGGGRLCYRFA